jgi:GrpB-like predicted nucleotidyltransferase (UPF0157 family)
LPAKIEIADYDPRWPQFFEIESAKISAARLAFRDWLRTHIRDHFRYERMAKIRAA